MSERLKWTDPEAGAECWIDEDGEANVQNPGGFEMGDFLCCASRYAAHLACEVANRDETIERLTKKADAAISAALADARREGREKERQEIISRLLEEFQVTGPNIAAALEPDDA